MTSQLNVDTIKGKTTEGSITIQGEGSATTNLQQGLLNILALIIVVQDIKDSFNQATITDNSSGNYTMTFTNAFGKHKLFSCSSSQKMTIHHWFKKSMITGNLILIILYLMEM